MGGAKRGRMARGRMDGLSHVGKSPDVVLSESLSVSAARSERSTTESVGHTMTECLPSCLGLIPAFSIDPAAGRDSSAVAAAAGVSIELVESICDFSFEEVVSSSQDWFARKTTLRCIYAIRTTEVCVV